MFESHIDALRPSRFGEWRYELLYALDDIGPLARRAGAAAARAGLIAAVPLHMIRPVAATTVTDARRAALGRLIDHAALFPPASMSMEDALAEDRRVRAAPEGWLVHRFVVPASRLGELPDDAPPAERRPRRAAARRRARRGRRAAALRATSRACSPSLRRSTSKFRPSDCTSSRSLAELGLRAKVRCGGAEVPSVEALAGFVRACREHGLVFKATAGLHRPIRRRGRARLPEPARGRRLRRRGAARSPRRIRRSSASTPGSSPGATTAPARTRSHACAASSSPASAAAPWRSPSSTCARSATCLRET